ncbi:uncharacterized protein B0P05DRAFT_467925, partial [Gilbertella persicaria]|uniref:uncharacterized protein n=1 Tax=Gilbertella persicaria TaxID=101096 RepID=UPI00222069EA
IYCFEQLEYPCFAEEKNRKMIKISIKGSLICNNPKCVSIKHGRSTKSQDALSYLAIGLSELTLCFLGVPILYFSQN